METTAAYKLSFDLRRETRGGIKLRADVKDGRIVFSGGSQGVHSIDVGISSQARILAHWDGYCENNGMSTPKDGQNVIFVGSNGKLYKGLVLKAGSKRASVTFHYRHGGEGRANVPFADLRF